MKPRRVLPIVSARAKATSHHDPVNHEFTRRCIFNVYPTTFANMRLKYWPVWLPAVRATCSGGPSATIRVSPPETAPPSGPEVQDPVRCFDDIQVVLDDQQRVAGCAQLEQHLEQLGHVMKMQTGHNGSSKI